MMMFVFVPPGATAFTRTPLPRYSYVSARVRFTTPPLLPRYAALHGRPCRPALDAVFTMPPLPVARRWGRA